MKHLARAGLLLLVVLFLVFVLPKVLHTNTVLADYGFHSQNSRVNEMEWATLPVSYAESSLCSTCHQVEYSKWSSSPHGPVACENCHGPAQNHLDSGALPIVDRSRELCGTCHAKTEGRPSSFPQVDMNEMGGQAACVTCHNPHDPMAGLPPKVSHSLTGRTDCQTCHNPHEPLQAIPPVMPHSVDGRTDCTSCHIASEASAPAPPVIPHTLDGRSNCLTCHNAGGLKPLPADHAASTIDVCATCHKSS